VRLVACCQKHIYENQYLLSIFICSLVAFFFCVIFRFPKCNQIILQ